MAGSSILSSDSQQFNNFTSTRQLYSLELYLGDGSTNGTPTITYADTTTQRFAVRMPSIAWLHYVKVAFISQTGGDAAGAVDFRFWQVPFDEPTRHAGYDLTYEAREIMVGQQREHNISDRPLMFGNRVGYLGQDPQGDDVTYQRNFMWIEVKPTDPTVNTPLIRVNLKFEV